MITCHGTDLIGFRSDPRYRKMAFVAAEKALAIIAISRQVKIEAKAVYDLSEEKLNHIRGGFDPAIFRVIPQVTKADVLDSISLRSVDKPLIVFVGKLTEFKGIDVLLKAAVIYEQVLPGVQTLIVGDGVLRDKMQALRDHFRLQEVHFLGYQPQATVVPSRNEPFGLVAIEALACGTPVVATNAGGLPNFVNQRVGALVSVDDYEELAQTIIAEINQGSKQNKGVYAAQYALKNFSWRSQVTKIIALYEQVLNAK